MDPYEQVESGIRGKFRHFCKIHDLYWMDFLGSVLRVCFILTLLTVSYLMWDQRGKADATIRDEMAKHPCPCVDWGFNPVTGELIRKSVVPVERVINITKGNTSSCLMGEC